MRLRINLPNATDATSFYRGMGPIALMERRYPHFRFDYDTPTYNWASLMKEDIVFMQRPYKPDHLKIIDMCKNNGKKVWVDFDDDLFTVPMSNPAYRVYGSDDTKMTIAKIITRADHVTVSTPFLKNVLETRAPKPLNEHITVVPNAYNSFLLDGVRKRYPALKTRQKLVMWRGSSTHHRDLAEYLDVLVDIVNRHKDWTFLFQGDKPWFVFEKLGDNAIFGDSLDPIEYFHMIRQLQPQLMIVPLHDSDFNRSKSNIAWMEGAFAGAATLAPDWDEWKRPGTLNYKDRESFGATLEAFLNGSYDLNELSEKAWTHITQELDLEVVNEKRKAVIDSLA